MSDACGLILKDKVGRLLIGRREPRGRKNLIAGHLRLAAPDESESCG